MKRFSIQIKGPHLIALFADGAPHTVQASQALPADAILESVTQDHDLQGATFTFRSDGTPSDVKFDQFVKFPVELTLVPVDPGESTPPVPNGSPPTQIPVSAANRVVSEVAGVVAGAEKIAAEVETILEPFTK